jgi:long-subunit fatty acid transport protein
MRSPALSLGLGIALVCLAGEARANPMDAFGLGSRGTAMGGAQAADAQDFGANYYNPAGLARAQELELSLGYVRADQFLYVNGANSGVPPVKGLVGGVVAPGRVFGIPFAFGAAMFLPDDVLSRVDDVPQTQPNWTLYGDLNQRLYVAANLAVSPLPWLQLGGGVAFQAATTGTVGITGSLVVLKSADSELRHDVDADLTAIRYPQVGARIELSKRVALGFVYRGQFSERLDIRALLSGGIQVLPGSAPLTTALYNLETASVSAFLPQQGVLGGSWEITDDLRANLDLTYVNWSAYVSPVASFDVKLDIPVPKGGWPPGITPPTTPAPTVAIPLGMHDTLVPHLGVEWRAIQFAKWEGFVRGGYEYDKSPIPEQTGVTNYIDRDRHAFSLGLGARLKHLLPELPGDVRFDGHAQLSELVSETTLKSNPADYVGDYVAGGHIWNVGGTMTLGF